MQFDVHRDQQMKSLKADDVEGQRLHHKQGKILPTAGTNRVISGPCPLITLSLQSSHTQDLPTALLSNTNSSTRFLLSSLSATKGHKRRNS